MATLTNAAIELRLADHQAFQDRILAPSHGPACVFSPKFRPNWASGEKEVEPSPEQLTHFEQVAEQIGVSPQYYAYSHPLKEWVRKNRYHRYVPEWLLKEWGMQLFDADVNCTL